MIRLHDAGGNVPQDEVLRRWVSRETPKSSYPNADPGEWSTERLVRELEESYDEPAEAAIRGSPTWTSVTVAGDEVGKLGAFPACGWDSLSNDGTIGDVVDRLQTEDLGDEFPSAIRKISEFKGMYPEQTFGALVARHYDDWPPSCEKGTIGPVPLSGRLVAGST